MDERITSFKVARVEFTMFCEIRGWTVDYFSNNPKNYRQYYATLGVFIMPKRRDDHEETAGS